MSQEVTANNAGNLLPRMTFKNFAIGATNRMAIHAARRVVDAPGEHFNPLFIHGASGLGKTHILHAIGNAIGPGVLYVPAHKFVSEYTYCSRHDSMASFHKKYRPARALLVDDIQDFSGNKEKTRDEFFQVFNYLYMNKIQIVLSADEHPVQIADLEDRLRSRFDWGLTVNVDPPDVATRFEILRVKCQEKHLLLSDPVIERLAQEETRNVRELEAMLHQIVAMCDLEALIPSVEIVEDMLAKGRPKTLVQDQTPKILRDITKKYNVTVTDLKGKNRRKEIVAARHQAMALLRQSGKSYSEIGRIMQRDHSTVLSALRKHSVIR